ncbi:transporter substrate-binding domain-containing protein [Nibrella saemangeumensis]|uniref:Transporter substrate-binding domain-containing protein n=1 Tax=Nibrella saemangeumensis TaxID=1084526 RepID=A0ABP8MWF8_9BACT
MKNVVRLIILTLLSGGCDRFPKDPNDTLNTVKGGTLVVGYSENPPWVQKTDSLPTGLEPDLVKAFAESLGARITWKNDTEQNLFEALEHREVHLVIAGITDDTPWKDKVTLTRPYLKAGKRKHVMAAIRGENAFIVHLETFLHKRESVLATRVQP